jgi:drug/metabolite transporter (DMT)-like permease
MQSFDPTVFLAVFLEMMGNIFWVLLAVALLGLAGFAWVLWRERTLHRRRLIRAEVLGVFGGFGALALMAYVTVSGFTDAGGPVDWLLIGIIWGAGLVGTTILSYAAMGVFDCMTGRCLERRTERGPAA